MQAERTTLWDRVRQETDPQILWNELCRSNSVRFLVSYNSKIYHAIVPEVIVPLCGWEQKSCSSKPAPQLFRTPPDHLRPCQNCLSKFSTQVEQRRRELTHDLAVQSGEFRVEEREYIGLLTSLKENNAYLKYKTVHIFSRCEIYVTNIKKWLEDYEKRSPDRFSRIMYAYQQNRFHAYIIYLNNDTNKKSKHYNLLLPGREDYYRSNKWRQVSQQVFARDGGRCKICDCDIMLVAHHAHYRTFGNETGEELVTLCKWCHQLFHRERTLFYE